MSRGVGADLVIRHFPLTGKIATGILIFQSGFNTRVPLHAEDMVWGTLAEKVLSFVALACRDSTLNCLSFGGGEGRCQHRPH